MTVSEIVGRASVEPLQIRLLGSFEILRGDEAIHAGGPKQRAVVAALALRANRSVSIEELTQALWGDDEHLDRRHSLQQHVSALRRLFGENGVADQVVINADGPGYRMNVARTAVDVFVFDALCKAAKVAITDGGLAKAEKLFSEALGLWSGDPLADFVSQDWFAVVGRALHEDRLVATEELMELRLSLGQHRTVVAELEGLVVSEPFRERLWAQLMLALYRSGRQADALAAYGRVRRTLVDELGVEPGKALRDLEAQILNQDSKLGVDALHPYPSGDGSTVVVSDERQSFIELPDGQQVHLTGGRLVVGRDPACAIRLDDTRVSRRHASVEVDEKGVWLFDLESTNGTMLNGNRIARCSLSDGDRLSFGGVEVVCHLR